MNDKANTEANVTTLKPKLTLQAEASKVSECNGC